MRWEPVSANSTNEIYHLWHNDKKLLTLTLHPFSNTARVESSEEKRVMLIRKEGFLRNKTILRNEYGVKIGELGKENGSRFIDLNNERFYYDISTGSKPELVIYKNSPEEPTIKCGLSNSGPQFLFENDREQSTSESGLLMALCWYLFQPVASENMMESAVG
jgi:predicted glycosyltransferase